VIWIFPIAFLVLALTNDAHHLSWIAMDRGLLTRGIAQWVWLSYTLVCNLVAAVFIAQPHGSKFPLYAKQTAVLFAGLVFPILGILVSMRPWIKQPGIDPTGVGFTCMGLVLLLGVQRYGLMDIVPIARDAVIEKMADGLIVLDIQDRIVDVNPPALRMLELAESPLGRPAQAVLGAWGEKLARLRETGAVHLETPYLRDPDRWCDLQVTALRGRGGVAYGWLLVVRDLTDRKQVEKQREMLIRDLEDALAEVKTLSGLLPICASCKKIRDDHGYWHQLEQFVTTHSGAQFSHGICPDCAHKLYPDLLKEE
jgi:PAS domain-containing protein